MVDQGVDTRKTLFLRLSIVLFFAELAHGMLLYGIIPELVSIRFPQGIMLFNLFPVRAEVAGLCLAVYTLAELVSKVPAGHWVDRQGPDTPLRLCLLVSLVTVPLMLLTRDPHMMLAGSFLHGLGAAAIWPAVISSWTRGRSARERGEIMGQILTGWMAGLGLGVILGNMLATLSGRAEQAVTYAPLLLWCIAIGAAFWGSERLGYPAHHGMDEAELQAKAAPVPRELVVMAVGLFVQNMAFGSLILAFNFLAVDHLMLNRFQFGLMFLLGGAPSVLLLQPMGKISDRVGRRNAVIRSMLLVGPMIIVVPFLKYIPVDPWVRLGIMVPGLLVAGIAYALMLPAWHALALGRIPQQQRGRSLGMLMSVEMAALACGHVLGPLLYEKVAFWMPFVLGGVVFATLAVIYQMGHILPPETHDDGH